MCGEKRLQFGVSSIRGETAANRQEKAEYLTLLWHPAVLSHGSRWRREKRVGVPASLFVNCIGPYCHFRRTRARPGQPICWVLPLVAGKLNSNCTAAQASRSVPGRTPLRRTQAG